MKAFAEAALRELGGVFAALDPAPVAAALEALANARHVALYGVGREGLAMRGLAMRLFHLGLDVSVVGDMTTPRLGAGDLLVVSAGPGIFSTVLGLMGEAHKAGARTLLFTAQPGKATELVDLSVRVPAQTMADDAGPAGVLPMGSLYEGALFVLFEGIVVALRDRLGVSAEAMRARHTNLE
jgi:6-phospho-3-hexuloisomerase